MTLLVAFATVSVAPSGIDSIHGNDIQTICVFLKKSETYKANSIWIIFYFFNNPVVIFT